MKRRRTAARGRGRPPASDRQVALLRGINVGKAKRITMADLRTLFQDLGYRDVRTLLNSGNVVFTVPEPRKGGERARIEAAIGDRLGVATSVTVLSPRELADAIRANPLAAEGRNPSRLLLMVLQEARSATKLKPHLAEDWEPEALALEGRIAYLWCPGGTLAGRLWPSVNRALGEGVTGRNLATMTKLLALVNAT